jgi:hypothetical protein
VLSPQRPIENDCSDAQAQPYGRKGEYLPFSILLRRRAEEKELHRREVMEAVKQASTALRGRFPCDELRAFGSLVSGRFDRHSDIDLMIKGLGPTKG